MNYSQKNQTKSFFETEAKNWCEYVNMSKDEFYFHADKFRDPRVWSKKNGYWYKTDIDNKERKYHKIRN